MGDVGYNSPGAFFFCFTKTCLLNGRKTVGRVIWDIKCVLVW